ncbi:hypothetical protein BKA60DRAFT_562564 [Fusarium oxysporum]|nr:hypothetical protein BKA60DRAFT_562564 [Fusarium oxysporum]
MPFTASDICKILLAIILPPVGVFLERGCGADFFINILLTILGTFLLSLIPTSNIQLHPTPPRFRAYPSLDRPFAHCSAVY